MIALVLALAAAPATVAIGTVTGPVLLDGLCPAAEWRGAAATDVGGGVTVLAQEDRGHVHLCLRLPAGSLGAYDLYLQDASGVVHNLHSSAQVGERVRTATGWTEWHWGNHRGWYSPPVPFTGLSEDAARRPLFSAQESREITLQKARFDLKPGWRLMLAVHALGADRRARVTYPATASADRPEGWATIRRG